MWLLLKTILIALLLFIVGVLFLGWYFSAPPYRGPLSDHFDGQRFHNENVATNGMWKFFKWMMNRKPGEWPAYRENNSYPPPESRIDGDHFRITFINHSTLLVQINGLNILTDPIWSERCSPISFMGPKRVRLPGISFDDLPTIDIILISHNHYDHLDIETLQRLWERDHPRIFAGLGNKALLEKYGITSTELDWWQNIPLNEELSLWATPAQHFSNRGLFDRNKTLWMGFLIETKGAKIYFAGDTGFGNHFQEIYHRFGSIDVALLPIGAFIPIWFMKYAHISPSEALEAAKILHARHSIGIHFGTFALADDAEDEPMIELARAKEEDGSHNLNVLEFGQHQEFVKRMF